MSGSPFKGYPALAVLIEEHFVLAHKFSQERVLLRDEQGVSKKAEKNPTLASLEGFKILVIFFPIPNDGWGER